MNPNGRLPLTGERTVPDIASENYWFRRHEAAYRFVLPHCRAARVLDAGCGEGSGAGLIAGVADGVVAMDYDALTVAHASRRYRQLAVVLANLVDLPVSDAAIDVVVCLQVIEHLWNQPRFLGECARVLRPGGVLILSTPNRLTFSPDWSPGTPPRNPFHSRELSPSELPLLLPRSLGPPTLLGVRHGARLGELDRCYGGLVAAQLATTPDHWPAGLPADVAGVRAEDFVINSTGLDTALDLVLVARRR
ncbi:MAG: class I SAM-dependent methyltransferase [Geodermatophilaceae bacterium]|nr:class I SAM-dependent methyltransferase [Geodermatophilaceae bacterium]